MTDYGDWVWSSIRPFEVSVGRRKSVTSRDLIIEYLKERKRAWSRDIARDLHLNLRTVRRVLYFLEEDGLVRRVYDGSKDYDVEWVGDA